MKKGETLKIQELLKLSVVTQLTSAGCRDIKAANLIYNQPAVLR